MGIENSGEHSWEPMTPEEMIEGVGEDSNRFETLAYTPTGMSPEQQAIYDEAASHPGAIELHGRADHLEDAQY